MKKLVICLLMFSLLFSVVTVNAININNSTVNINVNKCGVLSISGEYFSDFVMQDNENIISICVKDVGETSVDDESLDELKYVGEMMISDGMFSTSMHIISNPTILSVTITDTLGNSMCENVDYNPDVVELYNYTVTTGNKNSGLVAFLDLYGDSINFDFDAYNSLNEAQQKEVLNAFIDKGTGNSLDELIVIADSLNLFGRMIEYADDPEDIIKYIVAKVTEENNRFNCDTIKMFLKFFSLDDQKTLTNRYIGKAGFDFDEFCNDIKMSYLSDIKDYVELSAVLDEYTKVFDFDEDVLDDYKKLNNQLIVKRNLFNTLPVSSAEDFVDNFELCTGNQKQAEKNAVLSKPSGNSGGGGGGGRVSSAVTLPLNIPSENTEKAEQNLETDLVSGGKFDDLSEYAWAEESINILAANNIINGKSDKTFAPGDFVTREEFAKLIAASFRMTGADATVSFADINENDWFYPYVAALYRAGIIKGVNDNEYGVGQYITREDMAVILVRAAKAKETTIEKISNTNFADMNDVSKYANESVQILADAGIVNGVGEGKFLPKKNLTRAETAKVIYTFLKRIKSDIDYLNINEGGTN